MLVEIHLGPPNFYSDPSTKFLWGSGISVHWGMVYMIESASLSAKKHRLTWPDTLTWNVLTSFFGKLEET